jgi:small subunit ribosomal protein S5
MSDVEKVEKQNLENGPQDEASQNKGPKRRPPNRTNDPRNSKNDSADYQDCVVSVNRVAKVVKGGRRFSFSVMVVVGDGKGSVGFGLGKAKEVTEAKQKAIQSARKSMIRVPMFSKRTIHHDVVGHFGAGKVILRSAPSGTGIISGGPMRSIFEAAGIRDIVTKSLGSSNVHNMIRATFDALGNLSSPRGVSDRRRKKVKDILPTKAVEEEEK